MNMEENRDCSCDTPPIRRVSDRVCAVDLLIRGGFMIRNSVMATLLLGHLLAHSFRGDSVVRHSWWMICGAFYV